MQRKRAAMSIEEKKALARMAVSAQSQAKTWPVHRVFFSSAEYTHLLDGVVLNE